MRYSFLAYRPGNPSGIPTIVAASVEEFWTSDDMIRHAEHYARYGDVSVFVGKGKNSAGILCHTVLFAAA